MAPSELTHAEVIDLCTMLMACHVIKKNSKNGKNLVTVVHKAFILGENIDHWSIAISYGEEYQFFFIGHSFVRQAWDHTMSNYLECLQILNPYSDYICGGGWKVEQVRGEVLEAVKSRSIAVRGVFDHLEENDLFGHGCQPPQGVIRDLFQLGSSLLELGIKVVIYHHLMP